MSAVIIALMGTLWIAKSQVDKLRNEKNQAIAYIKAGNDSTTYYRNAHGIEVAKNEVLDLTVRNAKDLQDDERLAWIRNFESVNKRLNNIEQASRTTMQIVGDFKIPLGDTTIVNIDSTITRARKFDNHNEWFRIKGIVTSDSIVTTPYIPVPLESVIVWERKHKFLGIRFGKKQYSSETSSPNPYVHILKHEVIRIGKKK
jgi:hypothetical protein